MSQKNASKYVGEKGGYVERNNIGWKHRNAYVYSQSD